MVIFNQACLNHLLFGGVGPPRKARELLFCQSGNTLCLDENAHRQSRRRAVVRQRLTHKAATAKRAKGSLWSRMEDLVIHSDSLPPDLSSEQGSSEKLWPKP